MKVHLSSQLLPGLRLPGPTDAPTPSPIQNRHVPGTGTLYLPKHALHTKLLAAPDEKEPGAPCKHEPAVLQGTRWTISPNEGLDAGLHS